tara:strand:- start:13 stop:780 length:768 start_codon:yes stop_codon:yes gene_type:complete
LDFTIQIYKKLLSELISSGYSFITFNQYLTNSDLPQKFIILRHDVDKLPLNSEKFAQIQHSLGIKATYYFRSKKISWDEKIIKKIHSLGHEIGYHYENMDTCNGNLESSIVDFKKNLKKFRKIVPISTICMHGSPMSKYDNKSIWEKYNYRDLDIIGEPYFDLDFNSIYYLTDTGRSWNGKKFSVRDKMYQPLNFTKISFNTTNDIINAISNNKLPNKIMVTFHPQRWTDNLPYWLYELFFQNIKNIIKYFIIKF